MKKSLALYFLLSLFFILGLSQTARSLNNKETVSMTPSLVVKATIDSKIIETESATNITIEAKAKLFELYHKALHSLELSRSNTDATESFQQTVESAPEKILSIQDALKKISQSAPLESLPINADTPLTELEQILQKEQVDLAVSQSRLADLERSLTYRGKRPATINQRLAEAKQLQEEVFTDINIYHANDEKKSAFREANRWVLETLYIELNSEIKMLEQELLGNSIRLNLLQTERDKEIADSAWIEVRVESLNSLVNKKRQSRAAAEQIFAEKVKLETSGLDPLLVELSENNAKLADEVSQMTSQLEALSEKKESSEDIAKLIAADFKDTQNTLEMSGMVKGLGRVLLEQRKSLPDIQVYKLNSRLRKEEIAEIGVRWLRFQAEARRIADIDKTVHLFESKLQTTKTTIIDSTLRQLVEKRQELLKKAIEANQYYLGRLHGLQRVEDELLLTATVYDEFLIEHLLWLRSADPIHFKDLIDLPAESRRLIQILIEEHLLTTFIEQILWSPFFWLAFLTAVILVWKYKWFVAAITKTRKNVGKPMSDTFYSTLRALILTLFTASPLPLVFMVVGWLLQRTTSTPELSLALGSVLIRVALVYYLFRVSSLIAIPNGLGEGHFGWEKFRLQAWRVEINKLAWFCVPAICIYRTSIVLNPNGTGGMITEIAFITAYGFVAHFFFKIFHPKRGIFAHLRGGSFQKIIFQTSSIWFPLLLLYPIGLITLWTTGFLYTASALSVNLLYTLWLFAGLTLIYALLTRWLTLTRRRLAYEAIVEKRKAEVKARLADDGNETGESNTSPFEMPEIDLVALNDDVKELLHITVFITAVVGLYLIWASLFPALRIFDDITFWHQTVTVDGVEKRLPITLADFGLALIYAMGIGILAKRLPALLEMFLLQRFNMSSGSRYTISALTNYSIIVFGVLLILNTIGAQWSQLQWLVAALGVGIGFGLQEIIANFISGLIILFERPIQVGDTVTVGDTDGMVTKIQIRATTILNWDGKELLVPNKEFITGRLLNWSLSDHTTRILISIGIAYGSNVGLALKILKESALEDEHVLESPTPSVFFMNFGDNSLNLRLACFVDSVDDRLITISALNETINQKFNEAGIVIAFPQQDVHLDATKPLQVVLQKGD